MSGRRATRPIRKEIRSAALWLSLVAFVLRGVDADALNGIQSRCRTCTGFAIEKKRERERTRKLTPNEGYFCTGVTSTSDSRAALTESVMAS